MTKTIDRRKDVDVKIQTACEKFSERMYDNFEMLDDNLKHLQSEQFSCYNDIKQELDKINCVQSELLNNSKNKIKEVENLCDTFLSKSSSLEDIFSNSLKQLSDEHQSALLRILEELKEKETQFQNEIRENLYSLQACNEQQKSSLDSIRERIIEKFALNNTHIEKHTNKLNATLDVIKLKSLENLQELQEITTSLSEERYLMEEEQKLMEEFQKNIKALQQKRSKYNDNVSDKVENLNKYQQVIISTVKDTTDLSKEFLNSQTTDFKENCCLVEELTSQAELAIDQGVAKCSIIDMQLENMLKETLKQTQQISPRQSKYLKDISNTSQQNENETKRLRLDICAKIKTNTEEVSLSVDNYDKCIKEHLCTLDNTNSSLHKSIEEYRQAFNKQLYNCERDMDSFKRSELKTYKATGATPSKKVFSYPRVLAETSPHTRIVKRYRQENAWSDLDTTAPIDEESDGDVGIIYIQDTSDADGNDDAQAVLNSTPND